MLAIFFIAQFALGLEFLDCCYIFFVLTDVTFDRYIPVVVAYALEFVRPAHFYVEWLGWVDIPLLNGFLVEYLIINLLNSAYTDAFTRLESEKIEGKAP